MSALNAQNNSSTTGLEVRNNYQIPKWAGKPPSGLHLDVMKDNKMIQKLMIDEKKCYFFGRNKDMCEFVIDHGSCSRVHAVLVWHKHLNRSFLVDLGSTHGTFIGSIRLESNKPQQVFIDSELKFGASTRSYIIRERPQMNKHFPSMLTNSNNLNNSNSNNNSSLNDSKEEREDLSMSALSSLPEFEAELNNLTEFNTAHNKRIAQLVDINSTSSNLQSGSLGLSMPVIVKRKKKCVSFCEEEHVINPEDIDPSVGRFRNMIQTSVFIPKKRRSNPSEAHNQLMSSDFKKMKSLGENIFDGVSVSKKAELYDREFRTEDIDQQIDEEYEQEVDEEPSSKNSDQDNEFTNSVASKLGIKILNLAPDVDENYDDMISTDHLVEKQQQIQIEMIQKQIYQQKQLQQQQEQQQQQQMSLELSKKKIYAKEAWPGRKPQQTDSSALLKQSTQHSTTPNPTPPKTSITKSTPSPPVQAKPETSTQQQTQSSSNAQKRLII